MINDGKVVCSALRGNPSTAEILGDLVTEGGFDQNDAARVVYAAANTMCPDVLPRLQNEANAASRPKLKCQRRGRRVGHAGSPSDDPRCLMRRRLLWRNACTPAANRRAR